MLHRCIAANLLILCFGTSIVGAFVVPTPALTRYGRQASLTSAVEADAEAATTSEEGLSFTSENGYPVKQVLSEEDVVNLASFRNDLTNPEMMVEKAQQKLAKVDNTAAALKGLRTGLLIIGPIAGLYTYYLSGFGDLLSAVENYLGFGGTIGLILAFNNYRGGSVYVPDVAESTNRIVVDYAEGLKRKQDIGFVVLNEQEDNSKFKPCGGVMACCDGQLRNSKDSWPGVQYQEGYPPHIHIKNMLVHESMRRRGIGMALMEAFEKYAATECDAEMLTLEVEQENEAAVGLYERAGFEFTKNPNTFTKRKFMVKKLE